MKEEELEKIKMRKHTLAELCIDIGDGQAVITKEDLIEFHGCVPISIPELEYVIQEAKNYISFRNFRVFDRLFDEFPEIVDIPHAPAQIQQVKKVKPITQLMNEFTENNKSIEEHWGWNKITNIETAKSSILTSYMKDGEFNGDKIPIDMAKLRRTASIIDFGCGIGRNIKTLIEMRDEANRPDIIIYGYDFDNMVGMAKEYLGIEKYNKSIWIGHPISNLRNVHVEVIVAYIVFQHIPERELRAVLTVLCGILNRGGYMIVHSRGYMDDGHKNIWNILSEYFTPDQANTQFNPGDTSEHHQTVIFKPPIHNTLGRPLISEPDLRKFVTNLYHTYLRRNPDPGGLEDYTRKILAGETTKEAVEAAFKKYSINFSHLFLPDEFPEVKCGGSAEQAKIAYCMMGTDRLHEIKDYVPTVLPYVDRFIFIDGGSTDGTVKYMKSLNSDKVEVYVHPWNDQFSGQRNNYIKHLRDRNFSGWMLVSDSDEHYPEETLKNLRGLIANTEGTSTHCIAFRTMDVFLDDNDRTKEVSRNLANHWKPLLLKFNPKLHYEGEPHETIMDLQGNSVQSEMIYIHSRSRRKVLENAIQNFFISNSNRRSEKWLEFRYFCTQCGLEKFKEFFAKFKEGKLAPEIEGWIWEHRQDNENAGDSEVREMAQLYYEILHPEKKKV